MSDDSNTILFLNNSVLGAFLSSLFEDVDEVHSEDDDEEIKNFSDTISATRPVYTKMTLKTERLKTFDKWPVGIKQRPNELVSAGFFYTGRSDMTLCFFCGIEAKQWVDSDDPWMKHIILNNQCQYVLITKGVEYVNSINTNIVNDEKIDLNLNLDVSLDTECVSNLSTLCIICLEKTRNICLLPCKHVVLCGECVCSLIDNNCPMCRKVFTKSVQVYLN